MGRDEHDDESRCFSQNFCFFGIALTTHPSSLQGKEDGLVAFYRTSGLKKKSDSCTRLLDPEHLFGVFLLLPLASSIAKL